MTLYNFILLVLWLLVYPMGGQASGALNASGFSESIQQNRLPYF